VFATVKVALHNRKCCALQSMQPLDLHVWWHHFACAVVASMCVPLLLLLALLLQSDLGLNIREAHAFNTSDQFSLDVFVVDQFQPQVREGCGVGVDGHRLPWFLWLHPPCPYAKPYTACHSIRM
jgi:hypothetical protein